MTEEDMGPIDHRHLHHERSRHGKLCVYVRLPGAPRVRVKNPDDPESVAEAFRIAKGGTAVPAKAGSTRRKTAKGSLAALCVLYFASEEFKRLGAKTRSTRRGILDSCIEEPWEREPDWLYGDCPVKELSAKR